MRQKAFVLQNKGMNRDLSISKTDESSAYENHNIRILARDHDTLLSVTNERGNKVVVLEGLSADILRLSEDGELRLMETDNVRPFSVGSDEVIGDIAGFLLGWNVLNNHIILFTHQGDDVDHIYRIDYTPDDTFEAYRLFSGSLDFDCEHPIESVVYHETDEIQKIYWVDGKNVLRFMNFMEQPDETTGFYPWQNEYGYDSTYFDSNRKAEFGVKVSINKDNSGNTRANGVTQYLLTYFNKHGQETGYVWVSDLVYLSPLTHGGAADGTNANSVKLSISNLDTRFSNFRIYSIFRSSLDGTVTSFLVGEGKTESGIAIVVDDGAHLVAQDATRLLYLGSQEVHAGTLAHKDQTLFLGDLVSVGHDFKWLKQAIKDANMYDDKGISNCVSFVYSESDDCPSVQNIPYVENEGTYSYENQLKYTSSGITTFKGGEKYRFALKFQLDDGTETPAFWIGDKENWLYPIIDKDKNTIQRAVARFAFPPTLLSQLRNSEMNIRTVQLCIAEASYADRSVKAQGILNPTMFNTWERYNNRVFSVPSWISRPRNSEYAHRHFQVVKSASNSTGEIQCNWWGEDELAPVPYYQYDNYPDNPKYVREYGGDTDYDFLFVAYGLVVDKHYIPPQLSLCAYVYKAVLYDGGTSADLIGVTLPVVEYGKEVVVEVENKYKITGYRTPLYASTKSWSTAIEKNYTNLVDHLRDHCSIYPEYDEVVSMEVISNWYSTVNYELSMLHDRTLFFAGSGGASSSGYADSGSCINYTTSLSKWKDGERTTSGQVGRKLPARAMKQFMFVDENVVTLNSPEFDYEAVNIDNNDGLKLRIIGAARITSGYSDYTVDASPGKKPGSNLVDDKFSWTTSFGNPDGLLSWPLWEDRNLDEKTPEENQSLPDIKDRTSEHYNWGAASATYWLHMWNKNGIISGFDDPEDHDYGLLHRKIFANLKYSYDTVYRPIVDIRNGKGVYPLHSVRQYNYTSVQYAQLKIGENDVRSYNGNVQMSLIPPGRNKYPILFSTGVTDAESDTNSSYAFLYSAAPVQLEYMSSPHAVLSLETLIQNGMYHQRILPSISNDNTVYDTIPAYFGSTTDALVSWIDENPLLGYHVMEEFITVPGITDNDMFLFIGELYQEYDEAHPDERYGGITEMDIENCRFITAGPQYVLSDTDGVIYGDQGDTYFQRYDCLKTKPYSTGSVNNVIDITSFMVETHINIDGRTDLQRGIDNIASIDTEKFGQLNPVYSQKNNYRIQRDYDEDFYTDAYRSSITWSLEKHDSEDVDEWSHVTLASTLKLDGDKGVCQALRRYNNSIIAFQDRGISEILFNSRTQLTTQDGVPVEIANSGKVDGKRYITNKFGCTNKWSIVEGKSALYFVDNINKAFCGFSGQGIQPLSDRLGFSTWFRRNNTLAPWNPVSFDNIVAFYDRVHSDVYLVKNNDSENQPCLVYNEALGAFTSFFDYASVPMMTNVEDKFISFRDAKLWKQNEGLYCNFFGQQYDYWTQYRVTPEPFSDKIWTNIDYRADFYEVLDENGNSIVSEENLINGEPNEELSDRYKEWETFSDYKVWNEYQTTGFTPFTHEHFDRDDVRKKFRIWRLAVPRALKEGTNRYGLDRIRNPWVNILFRKQGGDARNLMQLHDIVVKYFE